MNSISKFRIFNKDLIFCNFIKTRCVRNLYGIFKPYMQIIRFTYVIYKPYVYTNVLYTYVNVMDIRGLKFMHVCASL